jgi:hypothetical protein
MNLTAEQKEQVAAWVAQGQKLSEIQDRLEQELGLRLTYLEVRLLVDDLRLTPKDQERPVAPAPLAPAGGAPPQGPGTAPASEPEPETPGVPGSVSVTVDNVARPGALISGQVSFSDGQQAGWFMDQMGRLGLLPQQQGYRPSAADMESFQLQLERELQHFGI